MNHPTTSGAALRMRRSRERKRRGGCFLSIDLDAADIAQLVKRGFLSAEAAARGDKAAIEAAVLLVWCRVGCSLGLIRHPMFGSAYLLSRYGWQRRYSNEPCRPLDDKTAAIRTRREPSAAQPGEKSRLP